MPYIEEVRLLPRARPGSQKQSACDGVDRAAPFDRSESSLPMVNAANGRQHERKKILSSLYPESLRVSTSAPRGTSQMPCCDLSVQRILANSPMQL
jgi:hypothetical protein